MTRALILLLLFGPSACAARQASTRTAPPQPARYVFSEDLPPETRVCVARSPFVTDLSCMPLDELRQWLRRRRLAQFAPDRGFDEPTVLGGRP